MESRRDLFLWPHDPNDIAYRRDLISVLGLVVATPTYLLRQTGAGFGPTIDLQHEHDEVMKELKAEIVRLLPPSLEMNDPAAIQHHSYVPRIGPLPSMGGGTPPVIELVEIIGDINASVQIVGGYVELGRLLLDVGRWWKNRLVAGGQYVVDMDRPIFLPESIRLMCIGHAHEAYRIRPTHEPHGFVREGLGGSAEHPTGQEMYTVAVPSGRKTYVYLVDGRGSFLDHYLMERGRMTSLDLPDWFGDAGVTRARGVARNLIFKPVESTSD